VTSAFVDRSCADPSLSDFCRDVHGIAAVMLRKIGEHLWRAGPKGVSFLALSMGVTPGRGRKSVAVSLAMADCALRDIRPKPRTPASPTPSAVAGI
jgi:hypothetical protein